MPQGHHSENSERDNLDSKLEKNGLPLLAECKDPSFCSDLLPGNCRLQIGGRGLRQESFLHLYSLQSEFSKWFSKLLGLTSSEFNGC